MGSCKYGLLKNSCLLSLIYIANNNRATKVEYLEVVQVLIDAIYFA